MSIADAITRVHSFIHSFLLSFIHSFTFRYLLTQFIVYSF